MSRHLILLDFTTRTIFGKNYRSLNTSLCNFLHSLLHPNTRLKPLFSNTLSLRNSENVSDQVWHPYRTTGKFKFCISWSLNTRTTTLKTEDSAKTKTGIPWIQPAFNYFLRRILFVNVVPKFLNSYTLPMEPLSIFTLWLRPTIWSCNIIMYLDLSASSSNSIFNSSRLIQ
jgi:hypothetical protein